MRSLAREAANRLWLGACANDHRRFVAALGAVEETQTRLLMNLLRRNATTEFGRSHHFDVISSPYRFQQTVPLTDYEDYRKSIDAIASGSPSVITSDRVLLLEPTSGSASASKLIPYTPSLRREFQRAISPWIVSLFQENPALMRGSSYWSLSPPLNPDGQHGCLRVGFASDTDYLGRLGRFACGLSAAVPPVVVKSPDMNAFLCQTLVHLLMRRDLALISVWSPTFLGALLDFFESHRDKIIASILCSGLTGTVDRARQIRAACTSVKVDYRSIWPSLQLVSCWTHGASASYARALHERLPGVKIQPKGLIATEAFVSLPFCSSRDPVLAVTSHFFEFRDLNTGDIRLAHELSRDAVYSVIVTTGGGFYRYQMFDMVQVTGHLGQAPCLRFLSREQIVSDLFGEKLNASHVEQCCMQALAKLGLSPSFHLLAPVTSHANAQPCYGLFLEIASLDQATANQLAAEVEAGLYTNFHYAHCRSLGQLGPLRLFLICSFNITAQSVYLAELSRRGIKLGNVKTAILDVKAGWENSFTGHWIASSVNGLVAQNVVG